MKLFGREITISKVSQPLAVKPKTRNYYEAAKSDRSTFDWLTTNLTADEVLRWNLRLMRFRSRSLAINNDHLKCFLRKLRINTVGANGFVMQSKVRLLNGNLDTRSNKLIEAAWSQWIKREFASVSGTESLKDLMNTGLETVARDGEVLIRKLKGYDNKFRFALQLIEADHLDELLNNEFSNGNTLRMGIEKNQWGKPVRYHLFAKHPGDSQFMRSYGQRYIQVPAEEIIHPFLKDRPTQSRGVPWAHTALIRLRMIGATEEAACVAMRVGASRMGFIIDGEESLGEEDGAPRDDYGNIISEVEAGMLERLPYGSDVKEFNASWPNGEYQPFQKALLRGISSGLGCSYNSLANDLEGVNFSSLRSGLLEERDAWKAVQTWWIESVLDQIFPDWLEMAILSGQLPLKYSDFERLNSPKWQGRRWEWVDPVKDINARIASLNAGLTTRGRICAEQGDDFEDIIEERKDEEEMIKAAGLSFESKAASPTKTIGDVTDTGSGDLAQQDTGGDTSNDTQN